LTEKNHRIFLGTSGWSYKEWVGPFYSKEDKSMLRAYSKVFDTAEIDSTFYRYPSKAMVMGWSRFSPEGFVFTAKLPKLITHEKILDLNRGVEEDLQKFIELMEPLSLSGKLGCILIQLRPKFVYNPKRLEEFFKILPTHVKFAVEFRDLSWVRQETWALLGKYKVAYTIVDEPLLPPEVHLTSDFAYFRWHGHGENIWYDYEYNEEQLEAWIPKIREAMNKTERAYGYFNNHFRGNAVKNCLQTLEMLGTITPNQAEAKNKVENYLRSQTRATEFKLEAFAEPKKMSFEELLRYFVAAGRLERARSIEDSELDITRQTDDRIEATLREYHIIIDVEGKKIYHDCADWGKILSTKKLCKHVGKLMFSIDRERATRTLARIYTEQDLWQFKQYPDPSLSTES